VAFSPLRAAQVKQAPLIPGNLIPKPLGDPNHWRADRTTAFPGSFPWLGGGAREGKDPGNEVADCRFDNSIKVTGYPNNY